MQKNLVNKILANGIIILLVGVNIQFAFANEVSTSATFDSEEDFFEITIENN